MSNQNTEQKNVEKAVMTREQADQYLGPMTPSDPQYRNSMQVDVRDFMVAVGQHVPGKMTMPSKKVVLARVKFILQEAMELAKACGVRTVTVDNATGQVTLEPTPYLDNPDYIAVDVVEVADALGDLLYVVHGTGVAYGMDLEPIFQAVHDNNMTKIPDGYMDDGGKRRKGPNYKELDLTMLVERMMVRSALRQELLGRNGPPS